jgi:hypothetical protein
MGESLFDGSMSEVFERRLAERTAGSGENEAADFRIEGTVTGEG